jgi:integrase
MATRGKSSAEETRKRLHRYIKGPFRSTWEKPAHEIVSAVIRDMLAHHMQRGITTTMNRVRSYLHAAFQYGLQSELDPRRRSRSSSWGLTGNPVTDVPRQADWERQGQTVMTAEDVHRAWHDLPQMRSRSPQGPLAVRLCLATAGQRITALLRLERSHVDLGKGIIDMPPSITKTGEPHVVPLTRQAMEVLEYLLAQAERRGIDLLFPSHTDDRKPMREDAVASLVIDYRKEMKASHWTVRDIRRTAKTVLGELGVTKDVRDRIHGHALHDVSSKNYDRYGYLREKKEGMDIWEKWLDDVL